MMRSRTIIAALAAALSLLAACSSDRPSGVAPAPAARAPVAPSRPPIEIAGRWTLSSPGSGSCAMTFGGAAGAGEGSIAPEGGCPGNFFTSRKWSFEQGSLIIKDHTGARLGQLALSGGGFEGQSTAGQAVTLSR